MSHSTKCQYDNYMELWVCDAACQVGILERIDRENRRKEALLKELTDGIPAKIAEARRRGAILDELIKAAREGY